MRKFDKNAIKIIIFSLLAVITYIFYILSDSPSKKFITADMNFSYSIIVLVVMAAVYIFIRIKK